MLDRYPSTHSLAHHWAYKHVKHIGMEKMSTQHVQHLWNRLKPINKYKTNERGQNQKWGARWREIVPGHLTSYKLTVQRMQR